MTLSVKILNVQLPISVFQELSNMFYYMNVGERTVSTVVYAPSALTASALA